MHEGDEITTVEGLGTQGQAGIVQQAFVEYDAFQCGFCTPGQLCSATAVLSEFRRGDASAATADVRSMPVTLTDAEIRERMSGNLCRCGAYQNIVGAIRACARAASAPTDSTEQAVVPGLARRVSSPG
jgi:xanthine dehydrogenase YagT iron-sulfur-binding subunit